MLCNDINNPFGKLFFPDVVKNIHLEVFDVKSRNNETIHIGLHESCKCKCSLDISVCNNKQR